MKVSKRACQSSATISYLEISSVPLLSVISVKSGIEVVYDSQEEYEDQDPQASAPSPATWTKKRQHAELEKEVGLVSPRVA